MASVYRVTAIWTGFTGAPGYTKFSFSDLTDNSSRNAAGLKVRTLFQDLAGFFPNATSIAVQPAVDEFDMATGALLGSQLMTTFPSAVTSVVTAGPYAGGSGFCITWNTGLVLSRRRVRGRTFFVPAIGAYDNIGTLSSSCITAIGTATTNFLAWTAPRPTVWSRQYNHASPPVQVGGALAPIDTYTAREIASKLRSRRL